MNDDELHELLDKNWYPDANNALHNQRLIWDFSYLQYKGIMTYDEINRKRRKNGYGLTVHVPRTFATIEGIRKNFNINQLKIDIEKQPDADILQIYKIRSMLNYDLDRSGTRDQVKKAGFEKLLYGNGFLYSFLMDRRTNQTKPVGKIDSKTGRVKVEKEDKESNRYYGMVARRVSPYSVFPDPNGTHHDVNNHIDRMCNYVCLRSVITYSLGSEMTSKLAIASTPIFIVSNLLLSPVLKATSFTLLAKFMAAVHCLNLTSLLISISPVILIFGLVISKSSKNIISSGSNPSFIILSNSFSLVFSFVFPTK